MALNRTLVVGGLLAFGAYLAAKALGGSKLPGGGGIQGTFTLSARAAGPARRHTYEAGAIVVNGVSVSSATGRWQGTIANGGNAPITVAPKLTLASGGAQANAAMGPAVVIQPGQSVAINIATTIGELATPGDVTAHIGFLDTHGNEVARQDSGVLGTVQAISPLTVTGGFTPTSGGTITSPTPAPAPTATTGDVIGTLRAGGLPVPQQIVTAGGKQSAPSDAQGNYAILGLPIGSYTPAVNSGDYIGSATVTVLAGQQVRADITLTPVAIPQLPF